MEAESLKLILKVNATVQFRGCIYYEKDFVVEFSLRKGGLKLRLSISEEYYDHFDAMLKEHPEILDEILEKGLRDQRKRFENE